LVVASKKVKVNNKLAATMKDRTLFAVHGL
jgi:hypothetical protein